MGRIVARGGLLECRRKGAGDKTTLHPPPSRPPRPSYPWLVVLQGASAGQRRALGRAEVLVGRDPAADLVLEDTGVSRRHFKILRASDDIYNLVDLASTNGVQVNGVRVDVASTTGSMSARWRGCASRSRRRAKRR